jgi:molecular chaperone IbpA
MTNTWDIYLPHAVGLSDMFHRLDSMTSHNKNYPPYNLIKHDASNYEIQVALAGFKAEEIEISTESNILKVASKTSGTDPEVTYLHKGVSRRSFAATWQLGDDVRVVDVEFNDGLLCISLERIVPDHQKLTWYDIKREAIREFLAEEDAK